MPECISCGKQEAEYVCSHCNRCYYCDKECQKEDWSLHKFSCTTQACIPIIETTKIPKERLKHRERYRILSAIPKHDYKKVVDSFFERQHSFAVNSKTEKGNYDVNNGIFNYAYDTAIGIIKLIVRKLYAGAKSLVNLPYEAYRALTATTQKGFARLAGLFDQNLFSGRPSASPSRREMGIDQHRQLTDFWEQSKNFLSVTWEILKQSGEEIYQMAKDAIEPLMEHVDECIGVTKTLLKRGLEILDTTLLVMKEIASQVVKASKAIWKKLEDIGCAIFSVFAGMANRLIEISDEMRIRISLHALRIITYLEKQSRNFMKSAIVIHLRDQANRFVNFISESFKKVENDVTAYFNSVITNSIVIKLFSVVPAAIRIGSFLMSLYTSFFPTLIGLLLQKAAALFGNAIMKTAYNLCLKLDELGKKMVSSFFGKRTAEKKLFPELDEHLDVIERMPQISKEDKRDVRETYEHYMRQVNRYYERLETVKEFDQMIFEHAERVLRNESIDTLTPSGQAVFNSPQAHYVEPIINSYFVSNYSCFLAYLSLLEANLPVKDPVPPGDGKDVEEKKKDPAEVLNEVETKVKTLAEYAKELTEYFDKEAEGQLLKLYKEIQEFVDKIAEQRRQVGQKATDYQCMQAANISESNVLGAITNFWEKLISYQKSKPTNILIVNAIQQGAKLSFQLLTDVFGILDYKESTIQYIVPLEYAAFGERTKALTKLITEFYIRRQCNLTIKLFLIGGLVAFGLLFLLNAGNAFNYQPPRRTKNEQKQSVDMVFNLDTSTNYLPASQYDRERFRADIYNIIDSTNTENEKLTSVGEKFNQMYKRTSEYFDGFKNISQFSNELIGVETSTTGISKLVPRNMQQSMFSSEVVNLISAIENAPESAVVKVDLTNYVNYGATGKAGHVLLPFLVCTATAGLACPIAIGASVLSAIYHYANNTNYNKYYVSIEDPGYFHTSTLFSTDITGGFLDFIDIFPNPTVETRASINVPQFKANAINKLRALYNDLLFQRKTQVDVSFVLGLSKPMIDLRNKYADKVSRLRLEEQYSPFIAGLLNGLSTFKSATGETVKTLLGTRDVDEIKRTLNIQDSLLGTAFAPPEYTMTGAQVFGNWLQEVFAPAFLITIGLICLITAISLYLESGKTTINLTSEQLASQTADSFLFTDLPISPFFRYLNYIVLAGFAAWIGSSLLYKFMHMFFHFLLTGVEEVFSLVFAAMLSVGTVAGIKWIVLKTLKVSEFVANRVAEVALPISTIARYFPLQLGQTLGVLQQEISAPKKVPTEEEQKMEKKEETEVRQRIPTEKKPEEETPAQIAQRQKTQLLLEKVKQSRAGKEKGE